MNVFLGISKHQIQGEGFEKAINENLKFKCQKLIDSISRVFDLNAKFEDLDLINEMQKFIDNIYQISNDTSIDVKLKTAFVGEKISKSLSKLYIDYEVAKCNKFLKQDIEQFEVEFGHLFDGNLQEHYESHRFDTRIFLSTLSTYNEKSDDLWEILKNRFSQCRKGKQMIHYLKIAVNPPETLKFQEQVTYNMRDRVEQLTQREIRGRRLFE